MQHITSFKRRHPPLGSYSIIAPRDFTSSTILLQRLVYTLPFFTTTSTLLSGSSKMPTSSSGFPFSTSTSRREPGPDLPQHVLLPEHARRVYRGAPEHHVAREARRRLAQAELARLLRLQRPEQVRAVANGHARVVRHPQRRDAAREHLLVLGLVMSVGVSQTFARRHVPRRVRVEQVAVLDAADAIVHCVPDGPRRVRVRRHVRPVAVGHVGDGADLGRRELSVLDAVRRAGHAAADHDLDEIRALAELLPRRG
ncbi:hypothetical protein ACQRIU_006815 [Beauveria bassiana]